MAWAYKQGANVSIAGVYTEGAKGGRKNVAASNPGQHSFPFLVGASELNELN